MNATISPQRRTTPQRAEPKSFMDSHEFVELRGATSPAAASESTRDRKGKSKPKPTPLTIALKDMSKKGTREEKQGLMASPLSPYEEERGGGGGEGRRVDLSPDSQAMPESPFASIRQSAADAVVAAFDQAGSINTNNNNNNNLRSDTNV